MVLFCTIPSSQMPQGPGSAQPLLRGQVSQGHILRMRRAIVLCLWLIVLLFLFVCLVWGFVVIAVFFVFLACFLLGKGCMFSFWGRFLFVLREREQVGEKAEREKESPC